MVPVIHGAGAGVAGLMLYVTHDVGSRDTADRVAWTASVNLPVDDGPSCGKLMRRTVNDAADLKAAAGVATNGRKLKKPFEHMSISWAPDEHPTKDAMKAAALEAIEARGYSGCQAFIACHNDRDHPHVHIVTCRVDPKTGRTRKPTHARKLQRWAEDYEQRTGALRIPNRRDRRLVREHNAQEIRAAVKEERRPALRRMPAMEPKRSRGPTGHAIRKRTADERREWSAILTEQDRGDTAATLAQARAGRVALNRRQTEDRIEAGHQRAERSERLATAAAVSPMQPGPVPERPGVDLARVRIEAPRAAPRLTEQRPEPPSPRADLARVRIEAPRAAPRLTEQRPEPPSPRADLARVRIEAPRAAPRLTEQPPEPPSAQNIAREQASEARVQEERIAAAEAARRKEQMRFTNIKAHVMDDAEREGAELANRRPAPTRALCEAARTELEAQHAAAGDRYTATAEVSGAPLAVGALRRELEREIILAVPEQGSKRHARIPPPRPEAIAELVHAVQDRADRLIRHAAVEQGLDLPPDNRTAAPADEQPSPPTETPAAPTATETPAAPTAAAPDPSPDDNAKIIEKIVERPSDAAGVPGGAAPVQKNRRGSSHDRD